MRRICLIPGLYCLSRRQPGVVQRPTTTQQQQRYGGMWRTNCTPPVWLPLPLSSPRGPTTRTRSTCAATSFRGTLDLSTRSDAQRDDEMQLYGLFHLFGTPSGLFEAVSPHVKTTYKSVPYDRWFLPADPPPEAVKYDDAREWTDHHGDRFVMDRMRDGDYEQIIVHATITLAEPYFRHLLSSPVLRKLHRVIRHLTPAASPPGPPISWAMTHGDMSVGLVATTPAFRGRGLARLCVAAVCAAQRAYLAPRTPTQQPCFAYIDPANAASQAMMTRVGFEKEREHTYTWCGVSHVIDDPHGQPHDEIPLPASKPADAA
ncbi:hypothetical protein DFJ77DRAFT_239972 [Powellomyces hirtus]|nr:hypothetical protein DFJ77DRAFT_239972 [Powellomyces hirtus]